MSLTDSFLLYPFSGERIGTLGSNAPATVPAGGSIILTSGGPNALPDLARILRKCNFLINAYRNNLGPKLILHGIIIYLLGKMFN
jgi:hypothetical protein